MASVTHENIDQFLGKFQGIANELEVQKSQLGSIFSIMQSNGWKGNNSTTFFQNMSEYQKNLENLKQQLEDFQQKIQSVNSTLEQTYDDVGAGA